MEQNDYYVYTWTRPDTGNVFYVGKGKRNRDTKNKSRNQIFMHIVDKLRNQGMEPIVARIQEGLTESQAFDLERAEIARHGRIDKGTGTLANLTDGGEGASGAVATEERRRACSEALRTKLSDPVEREKWREAQRKRYEDKDQRVKMSEVNRLRYNDPEQRKKTAAALRGKSKSKEHVANVSAALKIRWSADDSLIERHRDWRATSGPLPTNTSGYKGVSFDKAKGKWLAQLQTKGRNIHVGRFSDAESAARAYDAKARAVFGAAAYQNFPTSADNDNQPASTAASTGEAA